MKTIQSKGLASPNKSDGLELLYHTIVDAISNEVMDLSIIEGEEFRTNSFIRCVNDNWGLYNEDVPRCFINRRQAICNLYADYCDNGTFPFVDGRDRVSLFMTVINNHFLDFLK